MQLREVLDAIRNYGNASTKNTLMKHGAKEPVYGAKVADLKILHKQLKKNTPLAQQLFDSGVYDAQYLAGLLADGAEMTEQQLHHWAEASNSTGISEYTVAWVAAEHPEAWQLGLQWIDSDKEYIATTGWNTLASVAAMQPDATLDLPGIKKLFKRIEKEIHNAPNRVRYTMNGFVIGIGSYVEALHDQALETAAKIGDVTVDMNGTACKVPAAADYIAKARSRGPVKKKKTVKC